MAQNNNFVFSLDNLLVDTWNLEPYLSTRPGRDYLNNNFNEIKSKIPLLDQALLKTYNSIKNNNSNNIYLLSELSADNMKKFFTNLLDFYNLNDSNVKIIKNSSNLPDNSLILGSHPKHFNYRNFKQNFNFGLSIGYSDSIKVRSNLSQKDIITNSFNSGSIIHLDLYDLENTIIDYESNKLPDIDYDISDFQLIDSLNSNNSLSVFSTHFYVGDYLPYSKKNNFTGDWKKTIGADILNFKKSKTYYNSLRTKVPYFNNNSIYNSAISIWDSLNNLNNAIIDIPYISKNNNTLLVNAPNSKPNFFYSFNTNRIFTTALASKFGVDSIDLFNRLYPVSESHSSTHTRHLSHHHNSIGISKSNLSNLNNYSDIILFDDIYTTGTQLSYLTNSLRKFGYTHNIHYLTLGKTVSFTGFNDTSKSVKLSNKYI